LTSLKIFSAAPDISRFVTMASLSQT
jgi:hypothetical protein